MPPVTKYYGTICILTTAAVYLDIVHPLQLYLNFNSVYYELEVLSGVRRAFSVATHAMCLHRFGVSLPISFSTITLGSIFSFTCILCTLAGRALARWRCVNTVFDIAACWKTVLIVGALPTFFFCGCFARPFWRYDQRATRGFLTLMHL